MYSSLPYLFLLAFLILGVWLVDRQQRKLEQKDEQEDLVDEDTEDAVKALEDEVMRQDYRYRNLLGIGVEVETWGENVTLPIAILSADFQDKVYDYVINGICENGSYQITVNKLKAKTDNYGAYLSDNKIITNAQVLD